MFYYKIFVIILMTDKMEDFIDNIGEKVEHK